MPRWLIDMRITMKTLLLAFSLLLLAACGGGAHTESKHSSEHGAALAVEPVKGPHRGRLLTDGDFSVEVAIFETGVPPEFHVYVTDAGQPVSLATVTLTIDLKRLGGDLSRFTFAPENDYLKSNISVHEPHSFDVKVTAQYAGKQHIWAYNSYEGRTTIAADMAAAAEIKTAVAGPGVLRETLALYGTIQPNAERMRSVVARFPGPIRTVAKQIGDTVKAGDTLATIESNESLQVYTVTAPIAGVIAQRHANPGEAAGNEPLFVIADFSSVWADLTLFARDRARLQVGQRVTIAVAEGEPHSEGTVAFVVPAGTAGNQSLIARVQLNNKQSQWTPGLFVTGAVTVSETQAPLVVLNSALQTFRDFTVVFAKVGDTYEVRMLELGASDGELTEVLGGLEPGTVYVTDNSYLIKADIEKSGASHDH
jgi:membrane fusion protein, heavy metal efflux system